VRKDELRWTEQLVLRRLWQENYLKKTIPKGADRPPANGPGRTARTEEGGWTPSGLKTALKGLEFSIGGRRNFPSGRCGQGGERDTAGKEKEFNQSSGFLKGDLSRRDEVGRVR